ncbi:hypothetical protein BS47DRAFT_1298252 [Hydnum rufescens UP504]|uniref:PLAC8 family protein n=1 Tax=Hydnum rufescens UP504 TaxID=1448309 RepID=A0A9P6AU15_9AGAM|nr:hypothetical protein BS47DRAFT_1298252 [Hydnum rufescens UP504]
MLPCCSYAKNWVRFNHLAHHIPRTVTPALAIADCIVSSCSLVCPRILKFAHLQRYFLDLTRILVAGCLCFLSMGGRKNIGHRYHIDGGCCSDFFCTWCCVSCSLARESREVSLEEHSFRP